jgi:hypothetical protein
VAANDLLLRAAAVVVRDLEVSLLLLEKGMEEEEEEEEREEEANTKVLFCPLCLIVALLMVESLLHLLLPLLLLHLNVLFSPKRSNVCGLPEPY